MSKKNDIYNAALTLFIKYGFHATPTSKIAEKADISNGTLFYYFNTKKQLISELYLNIKEELKEYLLKGLEKNKNTYHKIKSIWMNYTEWGITNKEKFLFLEQFYNSPYINSITKKEANKSFDFIYNIFKKGIEEGILMKIDIPLILNFLKASVNSTINYKCKNPKISNKNLLNTTFIMFWRGIVNI